jgi:acetyl-CoA acyltransferase 2
VLVHSLDLPGSSCSEILLGDSEVVLTGGSESMSQAPYAVRNARWGTKLGQDLKLEDTLWAGLTGMYKPDTGGGGSADNGSNGSKPSFWDKKPI